MIDLAEVDFEKGGGLVTVVTQDAFSGAVLMVAHADRESIERTIATGEMHYRSRTRGLWHKGATSGNTQRVISLTLDCDRDAVLARVERAGPACHSGATSCFGELALDAEALGALDRTIASRARAEVGSGVEPSEHPTNALSADTPETSRDSRRSPGEALPSRTSYTRRLLDDRNLRLKKLGEEAAELVTACADSDQGRMVEEAADLVYHVLVALRASGVGLDELRRTLAARAAG